MIDSSHESVRSHRCIEVRPEHLAMPAPKFLSVLPKPILFGLYGALGGLIGAVFFGELAWQILKPPPPPATPQLALGSSASVTVYPGTVNTFVVRITREAFTGPVNVTFETL